MRGSCASSTTPATARPPSWRPPTSRPGRCRCASRSRRRAPATPMRTRCATVDDHGSERRRGQQAGRARTRRSPSRSRASTPRRSPSPTPRARAARRDVDVVAGNEPPQVDLDSPAATGRSTSPARRSAMRRSVTDREDGSLEDGRIAADRVVVTAEYLKDGPPASAPAAAAGHRSAGPADPHAEGKRLDGRQRLSRVPSGRSQVHRTDVQ